MRVVVAPDKFRGTASAAEVADAVARAAASVGWECTAVPLADGGEGTLEAFGGANKTTTVAGPLGDPVDASWRLSGNVAVIEMAQASGLVLAGGAENNDPLAASTFGTGELIEQAIDRGARRVLVGLGGSATTDGGLGALRALYPVQQLKGIEIVVATDVRTTFVDAAAVFGPQKGATPKQVEFLTRRLEKLIETYRSEYGVDVSEMPRAGAAGGLAGGLAAVGATLVDGFELIAEELDLYDQVEIADLVITGEGFLDEQSFEGKVVGGVQSYAEAAGVPLLVIAGQVFSDAPADLDVVSLTERFGSELSVADTARCIESVARDAMAQIEGIA